MRILEYSERLWTNFWSAALMITKIILPFVCTLLVLIYSVQPILQGLLRSVSPLLVLLPLYFWLLHEPRSVPLVLVFLLGFLVDILHFYPIGLNGFLFCLIYGGARLYRESRRESVWVLDVCSFGIVILLYQSVLTVFLMLDRGIVWDVNEFTLRTLVMVLLYVTLSPIFWFLHRFCKK